MVLDLAAPPPPCHLATPTIHEQPALLPATSGESLHRSQFQDRYPGCPVPPLRALGQACSWITPISHLFQREQVKV